MQDFIDAARKGDAASKNKMADFTAEIVTVLKDGQDNNRKIDGLRPIIDSIISLSSGSMRFLRMRLLWFVTSAIDGNRDNKSYYRLDSGRDWIERRANYTDSELRGKLLDAQTSIVEGRDALETMAVTFVKGIKTIIAETSKCPGKEDEELIASTATGMKESFEGNKTILIEKADEGIHKLESIEKELRS